MSQTTYSTFTMKSAKEKNVKKTVRKNIRLQNSIHLCSKHIRKLAYLYTCIVQTCAIWGHWGQFDLRVKQQTLMKDITGARKPGRWQKWLHMCTNTQV